MGTADQTSEAGSDTYDEILKIVGLRLKEARQKSNLTQKDVAEKAGLKQSYIFELETGRTNITLRTLAKMADVLELDIRDFFPERKSASASPTVFGLLCGVLEKMTAVLQEREEQAVKRQALDTELLTELRSFAALKTSLEQATHPVLKSLSKKPPRSTAGG